MRNLGERIKSVEVCELCNKTEFSGSGRCSTCTMVLKELKASSGCCLKSLMDIYNSSSDETFELSPSAWEKCLPGDLCANNLKTTQNTPHSITASSEKVTAASKVNPSSGPPSKMSSRLIAGIIIASIIFSVLSFVIIRFFYQRHQRNKRLRYEDYGYSQLKVILDDDLYHDEEDDDDQLLSAT